MKFVKGIGPRRAAALASAGIVTAHDLFSYVPRRYLDRSSVSTIAELRHLATAGVTDPRALEQDDPSVLRRDATVVGTVRSFRVLGGGRRARLVLVLGDATGSMQCVWFGGVHYWRKAFVVGETIAASGQPSSYGGTLQFIHPDIDRISSREEGPDAQDDSGAVDWDATLHTGGLVPLYPSSQELSRVGLDSAGFRRVLHRMIRESLSSVREVLPEQIVGERQLVSRSEAIKMVHFPRNRAELERGLQRLKYEELFRFQLKLAAKRSWMRSQAGGIAFSTRSSLARTLVDSLPYRLTAAQRRTIREISDDLSSHRPMNRLLQGDVGSGKTIVALIAMMIVVENDYQAVFLAPTEILAEQHFSSFERMLKSFPVQVRLLVGARPSKQRGELLEEIQHGAATIVVGTHALLEKDVSFAKLGLVVIDEQHRFGVAQRSSLRRKGNNPDVLVMTATPIPRTLSLTLYGDLDVSVIDELPGGRKPIRTLVREEPDKGGVYQFVRDQVAAGRQAYFVYPLIEESEALDLRAATVHLEELRKDVFPDLRLGLLHGRLASSEKEAVMDAFRQGAIDVLLATTVIEVGIDIPNATVMVIENAERFGLAQLHQLRGRVGRGGEQSYCILLTQRYRPSEGLPSADDESHRLAERRLAAMVRTTDGFQIAETDLRIRGPGDFFGTRQSGMPEFRVADLVRDGQILAEAREDAFRLIEEDPGLNDPSHRMLAEDLRAEFRDELPLLQTG